MTFDSEREFESAVIDCIRENGWKKYPVIPYPTEEELIDNWKNILSKNNIDRDCLNGQDLTDTEMEQVIDQVNACRTPLEKNGFINGKGVQIIRDNPADERHLGKAVTLEIFNRRNIEAKNSIYQIARQPKFKASNEIFPGRRGDFMLLINGMPVIHAELKKSGVDVLRACNQIETYSREGIFSRGIFSLVQVLLSRIQDDKVFLKIVLRGRPKLAAVHFEGISGNDADKLGKEFDIHVGDVVTENVLKTTSNKAKAYYANKGFTNTEVTTKMLTDTSGKGNYVILNYNIKKGKRVKIDSLIIEGNERVATNKLLRKMKNTHDVHYGKKLFVWTKGFWSRSKYREFELNEDLEQVIAYYNENSERHCVERCAGRLEDFRQQEETSGPREG